MPDRRKTRAEAVVAAPRKSFRRRYDDLEARRAALIARLGHAARGHPAYKRSLILLNDVFRRGRLAQRLAVLEAAAWLIDLLEKITSLA
jgi:predicted RNA polymerase sigma factor